MNTVVSAIYISVSILLFTLIGIAQSLPAVHFSYSNNVVPWLPWLTLGLGIYSIVDNKKR